MRTVRRLLELVLVVALAGALLAGTVVVVSPYVMEAANANQSVDNEIDLARLEDFAVRSYVYAADGTLIATLHGAENRSPVPLDKVPEPVVKSILAFEDAEFYYHGGVNLRGTFRALLENVSAGGVEQGGSTITQQLVKKSLLSDERDLSRKSEEATLAFRLEQQLARVAEQQGAPDPERAAKDQILEKYLNTVYFGSGAYGVQAAAETYWGKDVSELDWAESTLLAGLISNPSAYDPILHPQAAKRQRKRAIDRLVQLDEITPAQARDLDAAPLPTQRCEVADASSTTCGSLALPEKQGYFAEEVKQQLLSDPSFNLGATPQERYNAVFGGGLRIHTTLNPAAQQVAEQTVARVVPRNDIGATAAMVSIEPSTGAVRAMVGGPGFENFQYNITTHQPGRQTGSSFKTYTLLTALEQGNVPNDTIGGGGRFPNPGGSPPYYDREGPGGTLTSVTQASSNGAFVRLQQTVGAANVIEMAHRLGITSDLIEIPTLTLGTRDTTPIEMASAYSTIPNGGIRQPYYYIDKIEDRSGRLIYEHAPNGTRALSQQTACLATQILQANVQGGTGTRARLSRQAAAGKTGTTDDNTDAWFVGFTPYLVTAVWMGNPNDYQHPMNNLGGREVMGGLYPAQIWHDFNEAYHGGLTPLPFPKCANTRAPRGVKGLGDPKLLPNDGGGSTNPKDQKGQTQPPTRGTR